VFAEWHSFLAIIIKIAMKKIRLLSVLNLLVFCAHVFISYSTQFKLINNKDVGEVSNINPSLFTPASITFSIWGLIYLSLACLTLYHLLMAWRRPINDPANEDISRIGGWFIFNNIATAAWLIVWTQQMLGVSVLLIFLQLISLLIINVRLNIYDYKREISSRVFTQFPLSIYFAWLTIATIANVSSWLSALNFNAGISAVTWTVIMIAMAVLITMAVVFTRRNVFFGLVIIWALYGIILKRNTEGNAEGQLIIYTAWAGIILVGVGCIFQLIRNPGQKSNVVKYQVTND
jgi:hypothetical protein